jgi:hypothetical protein
MFPPVIVRIAENGLIHEEAHVDGAATVPFFVPPALLQTTENAPGGDRAEVFVIVDGSLREAAHKTRLTARAILSRSIRVGLSHMLVTTLELTAATTQLQGAIFRYSSVPADYPLPDAFNFSATTRRPLFRYAYECAESGRFWTAFPANRETLHNISRAETVPCPADNPFDGFLAAR